MLGASLSNELKYKEQAFDEKIEKIFNLAEKVPSSLFLTYLFFYFSFSNSMMHYACLVF
jgi:hypothetical protein